MGFKLDPVSLATGATQIGQNMLNAALTGATNRKNRKFAREMADKSRAWAIEDWNMQNEYNSPTSQMQRYKAAGLNPHLIYGQSNEAAAVRSTDQAKHENVAPQLNVDPQSIVATYNQTRMADASYDNALKQGQILDEERVLKKAQITDTLASASQKGVNTDRALFDLGIESELRNTSLEARKAALESTQANTQYTLDQNQRAKIAQSKDLKQAVATLAETWARTNNIQITSAEIQEKIKLLKYDQKLKEDELELRKAGLTPASPTYQKVVSKNLERIIGAYNKVKDFRDKWANPRIKLKFSPNK